MKGKGNINIYPLFFQLLTEKTGANYHAKCLALMTQLSARCLKMVQRQKMDAQCPCSQFVPQMQLNAQPKKTWMTVQSSLSAAVLNNCASHLHHLDQQLVHLHAHLLETAGQKIVLTLFNNTEFQSWQSLPFFSVAYGEIKCPLTCPIPCPYDMVKCDMPPDAPKMEDGCPMPLPPVCATSKAECPE